MNVSDLIDAFFIVMQITATKTIHKYIQNKLNSLILCVVVFQRNIFIPAKIPILCTNDEIPEISGLPVRFRAGV
jgi:hypothetical protein